MLFTAKTAISFPKTFLWVTTACTSQLLWQIFLNKQLVVRLYAVIGGKIFYGNVVSKSLYEAAVEMKNSEGYTENEFVENIIAAVENA